LFVAVFTGGDWQAKHFHIDVRSKEYFDNPPSGPPPHKMTDLRKAFGKVSGNDADLSITASFEIDPKQFPDIIRQTRIEAESGSVRMKVTGATVSVTGAPIHEVRWTMKDDAAKARIKMYAKRTAQLDDMYLVDSFVMMRDAFRAILLGE
jgi:hypothetical protein